MKPEHAQQWAAIRERGQLSFLLRTGVLRWGLPMFLIFVALSVYQQREPLVIVIAINAVAWTIGGLLFGYFMWHIGERNYRRHLANQDIQS